jgi:hypothetical protein
MSLFIGGMMIDRRKLKYLEENLVTATLSCGIASGSESGV